MNEKKLTKMDKEADKVISSWTFKTLAGNLLPPPLDTLIVGAAFARMGQKIGDIYGVKMDWDHLVKMGKAMVKGVGAVAGASYVGTSMLKYVPGVNIWVALLVQPPIVAAITYSVGNAFKQYYYVHITTGKDMTPEQMRKTAETLLKMKL